MTRVDQAGVFTYPAQAGTLCEILFQDGSAVRVPAAGDSVADLLFDESHQCLESFRQDEMIVRAPGISREASSPRRALPRRERGKGMRGAIGKRQDQDRFTFGQKPFRVGAAETGSLLGEVFHFPVSALGQPVLEGFVMRGRLGRRHAGQDESQTACFLSNSLFQRIPHRTTILT